MKQTDPRKPLTRISDRITFLYAERCIANRDDGAVTLTDAQGTVSVPAAKLSVLMLGPGTRITYAAVALLAEMRSTIIWVGERGVRYYCHGAPLAGNTRLLEAQARLVSNERTRLTVVRRMYAMRFPDEDVSSLTTQQLLGREGTRIRRVYEHESKRTGVQWDGRSYKVADYEASDPVNKALTACNSSLYGVVHAVIVSLGLAPGLGFIHARDERSLVYDIADLYKAEIVIPTAFDLAAEGYEDIGTAARQAIRDKMKDGKFLSRCVNDLQHLLEPDETEIYVEDLTTQIWAGRSGFTNAGRNHGDKP